jgi:hypothetical protein
MKMKSHSKLLLALCGFLLVPFAEIGARAQQAGGSITGVPGSENLTGEIRPLTPFAKAGDLR